MLEESMFLPVSVVPAPDELFFFGSLLDVVEPFDALSDRDLLGALFRRLYSTTLSKLVPEPPELRCRTRQRSSSSVRLFRFGLFVVKLGFILQVSLSASNDFVWSNKDAVLFARDRVDVLEEIRGAAPEVVLSLLLRLSTTST